jgi:thioesterase domain-containing protein
MRLRATGVEVPGVVAIDSPHPTERTPLTDGLLDAVSRSLSKGQAPNAGNSAISKRIHDLMMQSTRMLVQYDPYSSSSYSQLGTKTKWPGVVLLKATEDFDCAGLGCQPYDFLLNRKDPRSVVGNWEAFLKEDVTVFTIPGNHFEVFKKEHVSRRLYGNYSFMLTKFCRQTRYQRRWRVLVFLSRASRGDDRHRLPHS